MNGLYFTDLIEGEFSCMFALTNERNSKLFVQDGDPSENFALALGAWKKIGAELLAVPPRSGDINCIENIFHVVKRILKV